MHPLQDCKSIQVNNVNTKEDYSILTTTTMQNV
jgi:hypothetical protein